MKKVKGNAHRKRRKSSRANAKRKAKLRRTRQRQTRGERQGHHGQERDRPCRSVETDPRERGDPVGRLKEPKSMSEQLIIFDTTLRDGEQTPQAE